VEHERGNWCDESGNPDRAETGAASRGILTALTPMRRSLNLLRDDEVLEGVEVRRNNAAFLDALGTNAIPNPTKAGDHIRHFDELAVRV
jgi:hypothetical protein